MTEEQSRRWSAFAGLTTGIIILAVTSVGLIMFYTGHHAYHEAPAHWSDTVMRLMFGTER